MKLYAYDKVPAGDPHAVIIDISDADYERVKVTRSRERVARNAVGEFVEVTDQQTGARYRVASAPCGAPCHCAAVAERVVCDRGDAR